MLCLVFQLDDETDFHGDLRLDPLLTFVNNSMETTKETILTQLIDGPLGEVFDQKLARELITNVQYELTLVSIDSLSFPESLQQA